MAKKEEKLPLIANSPFMTATLSLLAGGWHFHYIPAVLFGGFSLSFGMYDYYLQIQSQKTHELDKLFRACGLSTKDDEVPNIVDKKQNAIGTAYVFDTPDGLAFSSFEAQAEKLSAHFGNPVKLFKLKENRIHMQVQQNYLKEMYPANFYEEPFIGLTGMQFALGVRQTPEGFEYVIIDYDKVESHILISGGSGAGKSTLLRLLYTQFIMKDITLHVIDAKLNEIGIFRDYPNLVVSSKPKEALDQILKLYDVMEERNHLFFVHRIVNFKQYNKKFPKHKLTPIVVVIDEFSPYRKNNKVKDALGQLLSMGRTAGIYVILSTQRIDSESMGDLKTNLGTRFSMKAETKADSGIAMGQGDSRAYNITNAGRLYMKYGKEHDAEMQVFNIETDACVKVVKDKLNGQFLYTTYQPEYDLNFVTGLPESKKLIPPVKVTDDPLSAYKNSMTREIDNKRSQLDEFEEQIKAQKSAIQPTPQPTPNTSHIPKESAKKMDSSTTINQIFRKNS